MAYSPTDFFIKNYDTIYSYIDNTTCKAETSTASKDCIFYELTENKNYTNRIQKYLSNISAGNENNENTKVKYYNQYMNLVNMSIGTVALIYYMYYFLKNKQQNGIK